MDAWPAAVTADQYERKNIAFRSDSSGILYVIKIRM